MADQSSFFETTDSRVTFSVTIDRARPLAPQVVLLRQAGLPWSIIEGLAGRTKQTLHAQIEAWRATLGT